MKAAIDQLVRGEGVMLKILNFLPYPFLISKLTDGEWHNIYVNQKFLDGIGYTTQEMPTANEWFRLAYPDETYREEVKNGWFVRLKGAEDQGDRTVFIGPDQISILSMLTLKKFG